MNHPNHKSLEIWQQAIILTVEIYNEVIKCLPPEEKHALSDQIRRSAVSVPSNIAEGCGRISTKEFIHFLGIARGSLLELDTQLEICKRIEYIEENKINHLQSVIFRVGKMLSGYMTFLERKTR